MKTIDYPDIIDQRLALAKWITSNQKFCRKINGKDGSEMIKLLGASELFGFGLKENVQIAMTDNARACANSLCLVLLREKIASQAIVAVEIRVFDPEKMMDMFGNDMLQEELQRLQDPLFFVAEVKRKTLSFYLSLRQLLNLLPA